MKANVLLMPTVNCLVNLSEFPFFVLTMRDVEHAHFERVSYQLKNFDLAIIFKDYNKQVLRINAIPVKYLETIKNWLDQMDILFSNGPNNLNWKNLMKRIREDPENFIEEGCWGFLADSSVDEEMSEDKGDDSDFDFDE